MNSTFGNIPIRLRPPLRFVHASDLHLDRTIEHVAEGPVHWEQRMLDISRHAAQRLFHKVVEEDVDFLILSGNVLNANLSPPGNLLFLIDQFEQLKQAGINVYWAGGEFDSPEDWPTAFPLPDNVHLFPSNAIQEYFFQRHDESENTPIVKIVGMSRNQQRKRIRVTEFPLDPGGLYTIAVANGEVDPESLAQRRINYWAMGGLARRQVFHGNPRKKGPDGKPIPFDAPDLSGTKQNRKDLPPQPYMVHYPGSTIARTPQDIGLYGATLVEIPQEAETSVSAFEPLLTFFPTSPIRWINDQISLEVTDDAGKLADELRLRIKNYRDTQKSDDLLINWFVDVPPGALASNLRRGSLTADLLSELRSLYGKDDPITWSVSITLLLPEQLPKPYYEQQTILGDFLRSVKHFQDTPHQILDLEHYVPKDWGTEETVHSLFLADKVESEIINPETEKPEKPKKETRLVQSPAQTETQQRVLREAAMIGLELLGNEPAHPQFFAHKPADENELNLGRMID